MRDFLIIDAAQRSPEWFQARLGKLTGSVAKDMLAKTAKGEPTAGRRNLLLRLVLERLTGKPQENDFISPAMQAGIDREPFAFAAYEALTGNVVERSGFITHTTLMAGCSLDGHLNGFQKLLSIKCRQPAAHLDFLRSHKVPPDAMAQIRHELWITGAQEHDYFSWNPDFPGEMQSRVITVKREDADIQSYAEAALIFLREIDTEVLTLKTELHGFAVVA